MRDQAAGLRELAPRAPYARSARQEEGPPAIVIGSGKGGVGKSMLGVLLAAAFARSGRRTLLLDGAQNQGNLHILLGVRPAAPLGAVLAGDAEPAALMVPVAENLVLVPGDSGAPAPGLESPGVLPVRRLQAQAQKRAHCPSSCASCCANQPPLASD